MSELLAWMDDIRRRFPDWNTSAALGRWPEIQNELAVGQRVSGEVIADMRSGVWVDIGVSIPALLHLTDRENVSGRPPTIHNNPAVGAIIDCRIRKLVNGKIVLTQLDFAS
jgi:ribosomal protein S1